ARCRRQEVGRTRRRRPLWNRRDPRAPPRSLPLDSPSSRPLALSEWSANTATTFTKSGYHKGPMGERLPPPPRDATLEVEVEPDTGQIQIPPPHPTPSPPTAPPPRPLGPRDRRTTAPPP